MSTAIQSATSATATTSTTASAKNVLGKDAFLQMMLAQLKNQDPLNPMDGTAFVAQLAQFSSLEQLSNLNTTMSALPTYLGQFNNAQMANLIGHNATATGNVINVSGSTANISYRLPSDIKSGTISIYNSNGLQVDTVKIGAQKTGVNTINWNSSSQATGSYTFDISATDKNGKTVSVDKLITGTITGASFKGNISYLTINGQEVAFSDVIAINKSSN
jgi:flagellar basal-body rod modification protein FlgD